MLLPIGANYCLLSRTFSEGTGIQKRKQMLSPLSKKAKNLSDASIYLSSRKKKKKKKKKKSVNIQSNLNKSNLDGSFTMVHSNLFFESLRNSSESSRKQILKGIFLFYHEIVCCVYSLESPHRRDSNEYTQHTIIV